MTDPLDELDDRCPSCGALVWDERCRACGHVIDTQSTPKPDDEAPGIRGY